MNHLIGEIISHYKIIELIGEGGMGVVYKAEDTRLNRIVALKILHPDLTVDKEATERFKREALAAAILNHPNIITIYEIGEHHGQSFIAMEYVEGETIRERIKRSSLSLDEITKYSIQICEGLNKAHQAGITHRDIKPENIIINIDGRAKIVDFGLAKLKGMNNLTSASSTLGTVNYMSPEQIQGEEIDHQSDIWSLGILIYEMITGELPFKGGIVPVKIYSILNEKPDLMATIRPDVSIELERIVGKSLEKNKNKRYKDIYLTLSDLKLLRTQGIKYTSIKKIIKKERFQKKFIYLYGGMVLLIALMLIVVILYFSSKVSKIGSIAVLPLQNLSNNPQQEYFSDGMTDALITELGKIKALNVISRTSVMRYKTTVKSLPQIAQDLKVNAIIEGSVTSADGMVRINVKLFEAKKDKHLWSENYQRELKNILPLQSEIAQAIAREIRIEITPEEQNRIENYTYQINPEAHEAYLRGRYFINKWTKKDIEQGINYFKSAIQIDPNHALAYVGLASAYEFMIWLGWLSPQEGWSIVKENAQKALRIDGTLAEAYIMLAEVEKLYAYDWDKAESHYKRAISLNPGFSFAHQTYAWYLSIRGRHEEALAEIDLAKKFDPFSAHHYQTAGWLYYHARRYDEMMANIKEALKLNPNFATAHMILGIVYLEQKRYDEAKIEIQKSIDLGGGNMPISELARAYALMGDKEKAYEILNQLIEKSKHEYLPATYIAAIYVGLGEFNSAMQWLKRAYEERTHDLVTINVRPCFDPLRSNPRFKALINKIGLAE